MKSKTLFILAAVFLVSCGNGARRQQRLAPENPEKITTDNSILDSETVLDTIIPVIGIKYKEKRSVDSQHKPVVLYFSENNLPEKELDLAEYFTSVNYVKLKFPFPEKGSFLGESKIYITYEQGSASMRDYNSEVHLLGDKFVVGDSYQGYYCFDSEGNYLNSIVTPDVWPNYDATNNALNIDNEVRKKFFGISTLGENYLLNVVENNRGTMYFGNTSTGKIYLQRPYYRGGGFISSANTYSQYYYHPERNPSVLMQTFSLEGDTLCRFTSYNPPLVKEESKGYYPQTLIMYEYDNQISFYQPYNDTIFRLKPPSELLPVYVMDFGNKRATVQDGYLGKHEGKYAPYELLETNQFIWYLFTEGRDTPAARDNGSVKFFYHYYDKKTQECYTIPEKHFPGNAFFKNSIENGIPVRGNFAKTNGTYLMESYTKYQLESIIKNDVFKSFTEAQQRKMKEMCDNMDYTDLFLVIIK